MKIQWYMYQDMFLVLYATTSPVGADVLQCSTAVWLCLTLTLPHWHCALGQQHCVMACLGVLWRNTLILT